MIRIDQRTFSKTFALIGSDASIVSNEVNFKIYSKISPTFLFCSQQLRRRQRDHVRGLVHHLGTLHPVSCHGETLSLLRNIVSATKRFD